MASFTIDRKGRMCVRRYMVGYLFVCILLVLEASLVFEETGKAEQGQHVYKMYCVMCHGSFGQGDGPLAADLTPTPANLASADVQHKSDEKLLTSIRRGKPGTSMPAWDGDLSKKDILNVFAYVRSLSHK